MAFQGVILTILAPTVLQWFKENYYFITCAQFYLIAFGILLALVGLAESAVAIIPRLKNKSSKKSILYFGQIAEFDLSDYKKKITGTSEEEYKEEIINQIHVLSGIALKKHRHFRNSIVLFLLGLGLLLGGYVCFVTSYGY